MEPQIQYTRTSDGVSIAYWTLGEGPPLVFLPPVPQHAQLDWRFAPIRELYEWLSRRHQMVRFDFRGRGMSRAGETTSETTDETDLLDLDAVVSQLAWGSFVLFGSGGSGGTAVRYAARHPECVRQLVLVDAVYPVPGMSVPPAVRALGALLPIDYFIYTEVLAAMIWGWQGSDRTRQYAELLRRSLTHEQALRGVGNTPDSLEDFASSLRRIATPALVVHHSDGPFATADAARRVAAEIPGARLVVLEGDALGGSYTDPLMMAAIDDFLGGAAGRSGTPAQLPAGMAVMLFLDIAGSTALTERMGDVAFRSAAGALDDEMCGAVRDAGGTPIEGKVMGDGVMAVFTSAAQAIHAGLRCAELSAASELALHVGVHAGDVIREENNVYGGAVNIAARICDASSPGEILVSATVRDLARTSAGVTFEDRGERALKGIDDLMRVFAVRTQIKMNPVDPIAP